MSYILCWSVSYITSLKISFNHFIVNVVKGVSILPFNWTIKMTIYSPYLMEATALHHSWELASLTLS